MYKVTLTTKRGLTFTYSSDRPFSEVATDGLISAMRLRRSLNRVARFNGEAQVGKAAKRRAKIEL
jgi:hypothetical protein